MDKSNRTLDVKHVAALIIGSTIGAGVISLTGPAAAATGYSAWLAYAVAVILGVIASYPYFLASGTAVYVGGVYVINSLYGHPVLGGIAGLSQIAAVLGQATVALTTGVFLNMVIPSVSAKVLTIIAVVVFWALGMMGADIFAKIEKYMSYVLIVGMFVLIIACIPKMNAPVFDFHGEKFFSNGASGFMLAVTLLTFSCQSWFAGLSVDHLTIDPKKTQVKAWYYAVPIIGVIYVLTMAAGLSQGLENFAGQTLATPAKIVLGNKLFYVWLIAGPLMALFTTLNGNMGAAAYSLKPLADSGWLPKFVGNTNKKGVPYVLQTFVALCIIIPVIFDLSVSQITTMLAPIFNLQLLLPFCFWCVPKKFPELWKNSTFSKMPMWVFHLTMAISLASRLLLLYFAMKSTTTNIFIINAIIFVALFVWCFLRYRKGKIDISMSWSPD